MPASTPQTTARVPGPLTVNLLVGMLCLIWGSTWLVIRQGLADLPPFTSAGARFVVAFIAFAAVTPWLRRVEGGDPPPTWLWLTLGSSNYVASYGIIYYCETLLPSGLVSVLWAVFPLMMAVSGHLYLEEKLHRRHWYGFVLGFLGVALLFITDLWDLATTTGAGDEPAASRGTVLLAALLLFASPLLCAVGTTLVKRFGSGCSSVELNRNAMLVGAVALLLLAWLTESDAEVEWTAQAIFSVAYLGLLGTCVTFGVLFWLIRYASATRLSLIAFVTPCIALLLGWALGGERLTDTMILGSGLVVLGVALAATPSRQV